MKKTSKFAIEILVKIDDYEKFKSLYNDFNVEFCNHLELSFCKIASFNFKQVDLETRLTDDLYCVCFYYKSNTSWPISNLFQEIKKAEIKYTLTINKNNIYNIIRYNPQYFIFKINDISVYINNFNLLSKPINNKVI